tara:strand:- start:127 stop:669 length:543 start_codon:yes stop_codon:yes gene_type:complete
MANFIIKPASSDDLLLQNDGGTTVVSIPGSGNPSIADDAGNTIATFETNTLNLGDKTLTKPIIKDYAEAYNTISGTQTSAFNFDLENGNVQTVTIGSMTANIGITNSLASNVNSLTVLMTNGGTATITFKAGAHGGGGNSVKWAGGSAPTLTTSGVDVLTFITFDGGTNYYGFTGGLAMS